MLKDAGIGFVMGALMSGIITFLIVAIILGESGVPTDLQSNIIGNLGTGVMSGGMSGFVCTIIAWKRYKKA